MSDGLDIRIKSTIEADEAASVTRIKGQMPNIEKALQSTPIKVPIVADTTRVATSIGASVQAATSSLKGAKVVVPINAAFKINTADTSAVKAEAERLFKQLSNTKGDLIDWNVGTRKLKSGVEEVRKIMLTYKNGANELVKTMFQLQQTRATKKRPATSEWVVSNNYGQNIGQLNRQIEAERKLSAVQIERLDRVAKASDLIKHKVGSDPKINSQFDFTKVDDAISKGDLNAAKLAYSDLNHQLEIFKLNNKPSGSQTAISKLPEQISAAGTELKKLEDRFSILQAKGVQVPQAITDKIRSLSDEIKTLSSGNIGESEISKFSSLSTEIGKVTRTAQEMESALGKNIAAEGASKLATDIKRAEQSLLEMKVNAKDAFAMPEYQSKWESLFKTISSGSILTKSQLSSFNSEVALLGKNMSTYQHGVNDAAKKAETLVGITRKAELLKLEISKNSTISGQFDFSKLNSEINSGNIDGAAKALGDLTYQYDLLQAATKKDFAAKAIENLPKQIINAEKQLSDLNKQLSVLQSKGAQVPQELVAKTAALSTEMNALSSKPMGVEDVSKFSVLSLEIEKVAAAVKDVNNEFGKKTASDAATKLQSDLQRAQQTLQNFRVDYSKAFTKPEFLQQWQGLWDTATNGSVKTRAELSALNSEISLLEKQMKGAGVATKTLWGQLTQNFQKFTMWLGVGNLFMSSVRAMRAMVDSVKAVDIQMTELRKVTDETESTYNNFFTNASRRAVELATSLDKYIGSVADFSRMGYNLPDSQKLADAATIYFNVGDGIQSMEESSSSVISTLKAFNMTADQSTKIIDIFNEVGRVLLPTLKVAISVKHQRWSRPRKDMMFVIQPFIWQKGLDFGESKRLNGNEIWKLTGVRNAMGI